MIQNNKLLILGAYRTEIEIVEAARIKGLYTIVTDNHENWDDAPAKRVADEAWNISWSDISELTVKCKEENIAGVMAGFSEKRVICAKKLCASLNLPFYAESSDLNVITDKYLFKQCCKESGVPVPREFVYGRSIDFPVIVKPADNGGSKGITVCYNEQELETAYQLAMSFSDSKEVIIEEYIVADETMSYFVVSDGKLHVSAMCDRYMFYFGNGITQLPIGYRYPSKHINILRSPKTLNQFATLISNLNIDNGLIAFQSFARNNELIPFDPTYRLDGTMTYHITEAINNANSLSMLINYSMTSSMSSEVNKENSDFSQVGFQLPILLGKGTISKIEGLDKIKELDGIIHVFQCHDIGAEMSKLADFSQIFCRIHMVAENIQRVKDNVKLSYDLLKVYDSNGNDMIIRTVKDELLNKLN